MTWTELGLKGRNQNWVFVSAIFFCFKIMGSISCIYKTFHRFLVLLSILKIRSTKVLFFVAIELICPLFFLTVGEWRKTILQAWCWFLYSIVRTYITLNQWKSIKNELKCVLNSRVTIGVLKAIFNFGWKSLLRRHVMISIKISLLFNEKYLHIFHVYFEYFSSLESSELK